MDTGKSDRSGSPVFISLGTGRGTINLMARHFERQGLIGHNRGRIGIVDRDGLEAIACACYKAMCNSLLELCG